MSNTLVRYYGIYRGVVSSTADPTGKKRLLVRVPQLNGEGVFPWALPCFPFLLDRPRVAEGSDSFGDGPGSLRVETITLRLPRTNDPVWIMFENGDPSKPVWVGTWLGV